MLESQRPATGPQACGSRNRPSWCGCVSDGLLLFAILRAMGSKGGEVTKPPLRLRCRHGGRMGPLMTPATPDNSLPVLDSMSRITFIPLPLLGRGGLRAAAG